MAGEICTDAFFVNIFGRLVCTFELEDRSHVDAVYGVVTFTKCFIYTPGTNTNPEADGYGFCVVYDPSPGDPNADPVVPADSDFPPGVTITGEFDGSPDLSGNLTTPRRACFNGTVTIDRDTYPGIDDQRYEHSILVILGFNPGA